MMQKKLFLGIAPSDSQRRQLAALQRQLTSSGRPVKPVNIHMTLFFLGMVSDETAQIFGSAIDSITWPQFKVTLDSLTLWRKPEIICLSGALNDSKLEFVLNSIQKIAADLGINKTHHGFIPHITLIRKAKKLPELKPALLASKAIILTPKMMQLYCSINSKNGVEYHVLKSWQLECVSS